MKAADYGTRTNAAAAFVSTNSICQGQQVPLLWPLIRQTGHQIAFAFTSFKWANLASHNAGVTVAIIGISKCPRGMRQLFMANDDGKVVVREVDHISAYLVAGPDVIVERAAQPMQGLSRMEFGNKPVDGGHLLLSASEVVQLGLDVEQRSDFIRRIYGSAEFIRGIERYVLWIEDEHRERALQNPAIQTRVDAVRSMRLASRDRGANEMSARPHQMREMNIGQRTTIVVPSVSSERRAYLPAGLVDNRTTVTNLAFGLFDAPIWHLAILLSRLHLVWIATVCGKLKTDFRYSNTLGWNTFPVPALTDKNKADLTRCAEEILIARETHFPDTISDLYDPEKMPLDLREAHERNDEVLERVYIGRKFRNDTERLEKLFEMYTKMTAGHAAANKRRVASA